MQSDTSQHGLGAAVLLENKPFAFSSCTLTETDRQFSQIEKELTVVFIMENLISLCMDVVILIDH